MSPRSIPVIQAELADVRRYLAEAPPHSGHGVREDLGDRVVALERELARARASATTEPEPSSRGPLSPAEVTRYLDRIGFRGAPGPTAAHLAALHRGHVQAVPFGNLDIVDGVPIRLDLPSLVGKVVDRRREGFCYELNGLFAALLRSVGFEVDLVAARATELADTPHAARDHLRLLVTDEDGDRWLADVGNGASWPEPLPLADGSEQDLGHGRVLLERLEDGWLTRTRDVDDGAWADEWRFDETARTLDDFADRCRWLTTHPDSPFRRGLRVTRTVPGGKLTLAGGRLLLTTADGREEEPVEHVDEVLLTHFGIDRART